MAGIIAGFLLVNGYSIPVAIAGGLLTGMLMGFFNGLFVAKFGLPSIIVTLGSMYIARGIGLVITAGEPLYPFPKAYTNLGQGTLGGIPTTVFVSLIAFVLILSKIRLVPMKSWLQLLGRR